MERLALWKERGRGECVESSNHVSLTLSMCFVSIHSHLYPVKLRSQHKNMFSLRPRSEATTWQRGKGDYLKTNNRNPIKASSVADKSDKLDQKYQIAQRSSIHFTRHFSLIIIRFIYQSSLSVIWSIRILYVRWPCIFILLSPLKDYIVRWAK